MSVTQKQIAEKLNVSSSLVGRALRGDLAVAQSTRERIAAAALEMGYDAGANRDARYLAARRYGHHLKQDAVAVLYPVGDLALRSLPFYASLLDGIEAEAAETGVELCLCPAPAGELPRLIREKKVDGVILLWHSPEHLAQIRALNLPAATLFEHSEGLAGLTVDDREGTYLATKHLLEAGHRRIAYLGVRESAELPGAALRLQGYLDALAEFDREAPAAWRETRLELPTTTATSYCTGCRVCAACVGWQTLNGKSGGSTNRGISLKGEVGFTALVCHNDAIAMGAIESAQREGVKVPTELSVTGFDDLSAAYHFQPAITSVQFSRPEMGRTVFRLLQEAIDKVHQGGGAAADIGTELHYVFPVALVLRETTKTLSGAASVGLVKQASLFES